MADVVVEATRRLGLDPDTQQQLRCAALAHDIGRVGISTHVWEHAGPLSQGEFDSVMLHSACTARIPGRAAGLDSLADLAACAHERFDGSDDARRLGDSQLPLAARLLAAADVVAAFGEARPHRPAHDLASIEKIVADEVAAGRLDREASAAALAVVGARLRSPAVKPVPMPAGLSEREGEVLRELAGVRTNKEIARRPVVSPKTVGHQVQAVYRKAGVPTRAGATLFAVEQGIAGASRSLPGQGYGDVDGQYGSGTPGR